MREIDSSSNMAIVSPDSLRCSSASCSELTRSSRDLGWNSLLLDHHTIHAGDEEYETVATKDQALAVMTRGEFNLESFNEGLWRKARYVQGTVGLTPGGKVNRLRRKAMRNVDPAEMVKIYIPSSLMALLADEYRHAGQQVPKEPLNALSFNDPVIMQTAVAMLRAVRKGASELYAETAAHWLVTHLLVCHQPDFSLSPRERCPGVLSDRRLARVLEYINNHYADELTLDSLSREAGISKYHFVKLFRQATGQTPHSFVAQVRLEEAKHLVLTTEMSISEIAICCGYHRPTHFATAFAARFGKTPSALRGTYVS